ncbi:hypothetical protein D3C79_801910 [compost metagenome]
MPPTTVSPIWYVPVSYKPIISPATASSTVSRSSARNCVDCVTLKDFPVRDNVIFIPRSNLPETIRTKAIRSRWAGFILA